MGGYLLTRNQWVQKVPEMQLPLESHGHDPEHIGLPTFTASSRKQTAANSLLEIDTKTKRLDKGGETTRVITKNILVYISKKF